MEFRVYRQWQELSPAVGAGVEALLEEAFPAEERRDMEEVRQLLGKTSLELLTLEEEDRVQGLLMLWNLEGLMFLENFAVDAGLRGRGIGARMLEYVWEHWKKPMLLEVEPPEGDMQRRRIGFYERNGFCLNDFLGEIADIAKYGTHHHTHQQRREPDGDLSTQGNLHLGQGGGKDDKGDSNAETLGIGVEQLLYQGEQAAQDATQAQGADNLQQGIEHHGQEAEGAADHSFGHTKGDGKDHQTYCVIQGHNGQEQIRKRPLGFVLVYHHNGGGRGSCCGHGAQHNTSGDRQLISQNQMEQQQGNIHQNRGG